MAIGFNERYSVQEGQREFHTVGTYIPGSKTLFVYVNGILMFLGEDHNYIEIDSHTIRFNYPLEADDIVVLATNAINPNIEILSIQTNQSILNKYGSESRLMANNRYSIELRVAGKDLSWSFSSKYAPLYSTKQNVKLDLGQLADSYSDDQINLILYQNSKDGYLSYTSRADYSATNPIPNSLKNWVRAKTNLDLINAAYLTLTGQSGSVEKRIGNMTVVKEVRLPALKDMMAYWQRKLSEAEVLLTDSIRVSAFVKAGSSMSFPLTARGSSF